MNTTPFCRARTALAIVAAALTVASCAGSSDPDVAGGPEPADTSVAAEPRVPAEADAGDTVLAPSSTTHFGLTWFSPADPATADTVEQRWDDARDAASVGRVLIDWIDIEPQRQDYRVSELDDSLGELVAADLAPMVTVAAVDVSGTEFPEWLGGFDPVTAADAYVEMVEAILPTLRAHDVWLLAIANEPPLADDELDRDDFATFVERVTGRLDAIAPDLPVTFTFAGGDPFIDDPAIERMRLAVDALSVNHYCLDGFLEVVPLDEATERIDDFVDVAGELPIVFQELGCPAGEANGSSDADQLAWFEVAFAHISSIDQIRAAFVFEFLDWSPETFDLSYGDVVDALEAEVGADFVERFRSWLLTSGLVRADGTTRPAFDHFLDVAAG